MDNFFSYRDEELYFHHSLDKTPCPSDFVAHTHDMFELYYCISGKGVFHVEGNAYPLQDGMLMLMRPTESHYTEIDPAHPYHRMALHFRQELLPFDASDVLLRPFLLREDGQYNAFLPQDFADDTYRRLLHNMVRPTTHVRMQILLHLPPLLFEVERAADKRMQDAASAPTTAIYRIIRHINEHLFEDLTLGTVCERFFISRSQLCRSFKRATGSTVWEYVQTKRLIAAKEQIRHGTAATDAAAACGFHDYSAFYRAYHKAFGTPPIRQKSTPQ